MFDHISLHREERLLKIQHAAEYLQTSRGFKMWLSVWYILIKTKTKEKTEK